MVTSLRCSGGTAEAVTWQFAGPAADALGALVLTPHLSGSGSGTTEVHASLNGGTPLVAGTSRMSQAVGLALDNTLTVEPVSCGEADGFRAEVLGVGLTPDLRVSAPAYGAVVGSASARIEGRSEWAAGVEVAGVPAGLAGGAFQGEVPLQEGENGIVVAARDFCGGVER